MGEFFRGWRRKAGVITLVMALVFMGEWIRSCYVTDLLSLKEVGLVGSLNGCVFAGMLMKFELNWACPEWTIEPHQKIEANETDAAVWRWFGFEYTTGEIFGIGVRGLTIPYWSMTTPLTLLSAFFLLSKPSKSIQKKITEPIAVEVK